MNTQLIEFQEKLGTAPDPEEKDQFGFTHLHWAVIDRNSDAVRHLVQSGADANSIASGHFGGFAEPTGCFEQRSKRFALDFDTAAYWQVRELTPLHIASSLDSVEIMKLLFEHGAIFDAAGYRGLSPVHCALCSGSEKALHALLRNGFNPDDKDEHSRTMLHWIAMDQADSRVGILLGGQISGFGLKINDPVLAVRQMLEHGADVTARDERGNTPLHLASATDMNEVAHLFVQHGADVNFQNYSGATALHLAAWFNSPKTARMLIKCGARVNCADTAGNTPLHIATTDDALDVHDIKMPDGTCCSRRGKNTVLELLVKNGADAHAENAAGNTPISIAKSKRMSSDTFNFLNLNS